MTVTGNAQRRYGTLNIMNGDGMLISLGSDYFVRYFDVSTRTMVKSAGIEQTSYVSYDRIPDICATLMHLFLFEESGNVYRQLHSKIETGVIMDHIWTLPYVSSSNFDVGPMSRSMHVGPDNNIYLGSYIRNNLSNEQTNYIYVFNQFGIDIRSFIIKPSDGYLQYYTSTQSPIICIVGEYIYNIYRPSYSGSDIIYPHKYVYFQKFTLLGELVMSKTYEEFYSISDPIPPRYGLYLIYNKIINCLYECVGGYGYDELAKWSLDGEFMGYYPMNVGELGTHLGGCSDNQNKFIYIYHREPLQYIGEYNGLLNLLNTIPTPERYGTAALTYIQPTFDPNLIDYTTKVCANKSMELSFTLSVTLLNQLKGRYVQLSNQNFSYGGKYNARIKSGSISDNYLEFDNIEFIGISGDENSDRTCYCPLVETLVGVYSHSSSNMIQKKIDGYIGPPFGTDAYISANITASITLIEGVTNETPPILTIFIGSRITVGPGNYRYYPIGQSYIQVGEGGTFQSQFTRIYLTTLISKQPLYLWATMMETAYGSRYSINIEFSNMQVLDCQGNPYIAENILPFNHYTCDIKFL